VPVPYSNPACVDPEEAFVAALSSCHMLFFLSIAAKKQFIVERYKDRAIGIMDKNDDGKLAMTAIHLHPEITFAGDRLPTSAQIAHA
jgi:organic hydroperoxide reductase OsmC/OhrA